MARFRFMKKAKKVEGWGTTTCGRIPFGKGGEWLSFGGQRRSLREFREKSHCGIILARV
jgi:hypothetical protein